MEHILLHWICSPRYSYLRAEEFRMSGQAIDQCFVDHYYYYYYYFPFTLAYRRELRCACLLPIFVFLSTLALRLLFIVLPILPPSFYLSNLSNLPVSLMYSSVCLMVFGSPNRISIRIFPLPTSPLNFFRCSLYCRHSRR